MKHLTAFLPLGLLLLSSCERPAKPVQRFVPIDEPNHEGVALDTATGTLCKTWNWSYNANAPSDAKGGLDDLKQCYQLYKEDPVDVR